MAANTKRRTPYSLTKAKRVEDSYSVKRKEKCKYGYPGTEESAYNETRNGVYRKLSSEWNTLNSNSTREYTQGVIAFSVSLKATDYEGGGAVCEISRYACGSSMTLPAS